MFSKIKHFLNDECGAQVTEYVIIVTVSAVGGATALKTVRDAGQVKFEEVAVEIDGTSTGG
jgi:Flp pilus assembly pilin Flp